MRADGWSIGFVLAGLAAIIGMYACLRYALPERTNNPEWLLYGLVGLGPYAVAAYGSGAAARRTRARVVANGCGIVVCLAGIVMLWAAVDDAVYVRTVRDAGREHGIPESPFVVLFLLPFQGLAALVGAVVGSLSHDAYRR